MSINNKLGCSKPFIVLKKLRRAQAKKRTFKLAPNYLLSATKINLIDYQTLILNSITTT